MLAIVTVEKNAEETGWNTQNTERNTRVGWARNAWVDSRVAALTHELVPGRIHQFRVKETYSGQNGHIKRHGIEWIDIRGALRTKVKLR